MITIVEIDSIMLIVVELSSEHVREQKNVYDVDAFLIVLIVDLRHHRRIRQILLRVDNIRDYASFSSFDINNVKRLICSVIETTLSYIRCW